MTTKQPATPLPWSDDDNALELVLSQNPTIAMIRAEHDRLLALNVELVKALDDVRSYAALLVPSKGSADAGKRDRILAIIGSAINAASRA